MRSGFRVLALAAAAGWLVSLHRAKDARFRVFAVTFAILLGAGYVGGWLPPLRQVQPYRFVLPAFYLATLPAGAFLVDAASEVWASRREGTLQRPLAWLLGVALVVGVPRLVRDALYFLPEFVPRNEHPLPGIAPNVNGAPGLGAVPWPDAFDYKHAPMGDDLRTLIQFVRANDDGRSRWLVEAWALGERFAWATQAQVLGGFRELNLEHSDANWFRKHPDGGSPSPKELTEYLRRYNVGWVVVTAPVPALEGRGDVLALHARVAGHRIYKVKQAPSFLESNEPANVKASLDRIEVTGAPPGDLVLRYHYMETLRCSPGCSLHRVEIPGDRVGFLGVRDAPADFVIENPR